MEGRYGVEGRGRGRRRDRISRRLRAEPPRCLEIFLLDERNLIRKISHT